MSYPKLHREGDCDKCLKKVGKKNLYPVGFLFLDRSDKIHPKIYDDYHQYYICDACRKKGV